MIRSPAHSTLEASSGAGNPPTDMSAPMFSLFAAEERNAKRDRWSDPLKVLDQAIDFGERARAVDAKLVVGDWSSQDFVDTQISIAVSLPRTAQD